jgi:hypothetical protein
LSVNASDRFIVFSYDTKKYPFQQILAKYVFRVPRIDLLHYSWRKQQKRESLSYKDNIVLRKLMQNLPDESLFYKVYHHWINRELAPHYANKVSYSEHPKMRIHLSGTESVSGFHRDADVTGRLDQLNCYLPFTDVFNTSTVWCETTYESGIYKPLNLKYGEALIWDGGLLKHGTYPNQTDNTRVSCDFRFHCKRMEKVQGPWREVLNSRASIL